MLAAPDLTRLFKLEIDAVLLQVDADGVDHPICFFPANLVPAPLLGD